MLLLVIVFIKSIENKLGQKLVQGCGLGRGMARQRCGPSRVWPRQECGLNRVWGLVRGEVQARVCPKPGMGPS